MIQVNHKRIRTLRLARGWTQKVLCEEAKVSLRTVKSLEAGASVGATTLRKVADALEVSVSSLFQDYAGTDSGRDSPRFILQQILPTKIDTDLARLVRDGAFADMYSDYDSAIARFKEARDEEFHERLETKAQLIVRLASSLDNAGKSEIAIRELEPLLVERRWKKLKVQVVDWVKYHVAVAYRRVAEKQHPLGSEDLKKAEEIFRQLTQCREPAQQVAATHQLGIICWIQSRPRDPESKLDRTRRNLRKEARCYFERAAASWRETDNYREGYALRRLADIEVHEGNHSQAFDLLLDALEIFTRNGCERYRQEVRTRLREGVWGAP